MANRNGIFHDMIILIQNVKTQVTIEILIIYNVVKYAMERKKVKNNLKTNVRFSIDRWIQCKSYAMLMTLMWIV